MTEHLKIELRFFLGSAFHTTGNLRRPGVDRALARNAAGQLVIPATTVKGFLRERAEVLLRTWGHAVCIGPEPEGMCGGPLCLVCRVFGNPRHPAPLRFSEATLLTLAESTARSGVAISRHRRAAYPQRLFFTETTDPVPTEWWATCEGVFGDAGASLRAAALVALAARWGAAIGGGRTRGLGWIDGVGVRATLNGTEIPERDLAQFWKAWKEGGDVVED